MACREDKDYAAAAAGSRNLHIVANLRNNIFAAAGMPNVNCMHIHIANIITTVIIIMIIILIIMIIIMTVQVPIVWSEYYISRL